MSRPAESAAIDSGFRLQRAERVGALNVEFREFRHEPTGARHIHIAAEDSNNTFVVAFRTVPEDSSGVAHILEHTVLCGSQRFPVRDPFFMMLRRSLNTFMNAMTGSDMTAYPFATQNRKDFDNLLAVYLDAVFFPRLDPLDFAQEGHRLEFERGDDPSSGLRYKGVVYNEMKGAMSSPVAQLWYGLSAHLFQRSTYHYNSGGDPEEIPKLTYQQLRDFHARHYHPSNAVFFTYGDFPPEEHQRRIHELALQCFEAAPEPPPIDDEPRFDAPRRAQASYAVSEQEGTTARTHIVVGWLLPHSDDPVDLLRARLLEALLLQDSGSPLRKALETSELAKAPSELCGLDDSMREPVFVCGVEGSEPEHTEAVEALVLGVLEEVAEHGLPDSHIEAALHQLELSQRQVGDRFPYGLQLMNRMLPAVIHGGDPLQELDIDRSLAGLREQVEAPDFVRRTVRELLLDNRHRVVFTMVPDLEAAGRAARRERERLEAEAARMSEAERGNIVELAAKLTERQAIEDDPDALPKVGIEDVPTEIRVREGERRDTGGLRSHWYRAGTNGLVHVEVLLALGELGPQALARLSLLADLLPELGAGEEDYLAVQSRQSRTGHIDSRASLRCAVDDAGRLSGYFVVSAEGLARQQAALAELLARSAAEVRFDEQRRLRELIAQARGDAEADVTDRGHALAALAAARGIAPAARVGHHAHGLAGVQAIKALDDGFEEAGAISAFAEELAGLHERVLAGRPELLVVSDGTAEAALGEALEGAFARLDPAGAPPADLPVSAEGELVREAWSTSTQVNFCGAAYPAVPAAHADAAAFAVLGHFLRDGFLHRAIREQGGAYGAGAAYDADSASFRFFSYRDPRVAGTLADFQHALDWLQGRHDAQRVEEAILGAIKDLDAPRSPAGEAIRAHYNALFGRTPAFRKRLREQVLAVTLADLQRVGRDYLDPDRRNVAVIGNRDSLAEAEGLGLEVKTL